MSPCRDESFNGFDGWMWGTDDRSLLQSCCLFVSAAKATVACSGDFSASSLISELLKHWLVLKVIQVSFHLSSLSLKPQTCFSFSLHEYLTLAPSMAFGPEGLPWAYGGRHLEPEILSQSLESKGDTSCEGSSSFISMSVDKIWEN